MTKYRAVLSTTFAHSISCLDIWLERPPRQKLKKKKKKKKKKVSAA
jgi:hypothetical protein